MTSPVTWDLFAEALASPHYLAAQQRVLRQPADRRDLKIGQPQLTRQMCDLERMLGATLLTRSAAGALPTALDKSLSRVPSKLPINSLSSAASAS